MKSYIAKIVGLGLVFTSISVLTACNTVGGTVSGAGEDLQAVGNTVTGTPTPTYTTHEKMMMHKKMMHKKMMHDKMMHKKMMHKKMMHEEMMDKKMMDKKMMMKKSSDMMDDQMPSGQ